MLLSRDTHQHLRLRLPRERGVDFPLAAAIRLFRRDRGREGMRLVGDYASWAALAPFGGVGGGSRLVGFGGWEEGVGGGGGRTLGTEAGAARNL